MTLKDLDEIEAQLDETVPYYVPTLIAEIRRLRAVHAEATRAERERLLPFLKRNAYIRDSKGFVGEWIALPKANYDKLREALAASDPGEGTSHE